MKKILFIYDDKNNDTSDILHKDDSELIVKCTAESALKTIEQHVDFNLIVFKGSVLEIEDFEFCRKIQNLVQCPIIYLPSKITTLNNILGLEMNENDYIFQPFPIEEFIEKTASYIKEGLTGIKEEFAGIQLNNDNVIAFGDLGINPEDHEVYKNGQKIELSPLEYKLLLFLVDNKGKILTNEQIINCVWGIAYGDVRMLRVAIRRLRSKIDPYGGYITTIRGKGYKLTIPQSTAVNC